MAAVLLMKPETAAPKPIIHNKRGLERPRDKVIMRAPSQLVMPVSVKPSPTTNKTAIMMTAESAKPDSAWLTDMTPVK